MKPMVSLELDDDSILDMDCPIPIGVKDRPTYPYGTQICLTDAECKKLDVDAAEAFVGGMVHIHAMGRITSVSSNETSSGTRQRVEIQLESMCVIEPEDEENVQAERSMRKSPLHDRS